MPQRRSRIAHLPTRHGHRLVVKFQLLGLLQFLQASNPGVKVFLLVGRATMASLTSLFPNLQLGLEVRSRLHHSMLTLFLS